MWFFLLLYTAKTFSAYWVGIQIWYGFTFCIFYGIFTILTFQSTTDNCLKDCVTHNVSPGEPSSFKVSVGSNHVLFTIVFFKFFVKYQSSIIKWNGLSLFFVSFIMCAFITLVKTTIDLSVKIDIPSVNQPTLSSMTVWLTKAHLWWLWIMVFSRSSFPVTSHLYTEILTNVLL